MSAEEKMVSVLKQRKKKLQKRAMIPERGACRLCKREVVVKQRGYTHVRKWSLESHAVHHLPCVRECPVCHMKLKGKKDSLRHLKNVHKVENQPAILLISEEEYVNRVRQKMEECFPGLVTDLSTYRVTV